ncbi:hypothetical protein L1049_010572 [Liquidambar formosana]|uniref:Uncharacterized protein n=1 Tax=Liquidambar formosana TaxID=63359 RepID=A0AAP0N9K4_LIQFO
MGDTSHLERMGRELKCPICLSLLNSAVSLTCNHVFCNSCIVKSMKLDSNCPVCKVPYQRREIRPAPHMDNLVSIYKNMEVASGINIFVTQNAPSTKLSDEQKKAEGDHNCGGQETSGTCQGRAEKGRTFKGKGCKKSLKPNQKNSDTNLVKPSFPTKKRVQVPQYPLSGTPTQPANFESGLGEITKDVPRNSSIVLNEKPTFNEKGELVFSPFFWLREDEDGEKISQQMDGDHLIDTPPPNGPTFSDLKDSDNEMPSKMTPTGEVHSKSNIAGLFDSEMFEWTQRACSPELCSSPTKMQVADTDEFNGIQEKEVVALSHSRFTDEESVVGIMKCTNTEQGTAIIDVELPNMFHSRTKNANYQSRIKKSNKRGRKVGERVQKKCAKSNMDQVGIHDDSKQVAETQEEMRENNGNSSNLEKAAKRTKVSSDKNPELKEYPVRSKNQRPDSAKGNTLEEKSATESQINEDMIPQLLLSSFIRDDNTKSSDFGEKTSKNARDIKSAINLKCTRQLRSLKKLKVSFDDNSKDSLVGAVQEDHRKVAAKETQPLKKVQGSPEVKVLDDLSTVEKDLPVTTGVVLRKCETIPNKIQCAFCHSSEDTEVFGEMIHYFNGKPVAADYNGGSNVIHSHRNCTEWAPDVYFEDDTVINLEGELGRSRRIKCSLCGIKGAALGCYEKRCHRSFHVPCAKKMPECRWDTVNFVMLCPIHASSKLPNEISGSQGKRRKKIIPKGQSHTQRAQVSVKHDTRMSWHLNSGGSSEKIVLCCSALTTAEKEIVSVFEKLSGVAELKKWCSSVTHVIASTDENGACRRTLKILMGILEGKWILSIDWIKACMKAMKPVDEEQYEISVDVHGIKDGPRLGRLRLISKQPKLFDGFKFYFAGDFIPSYKGYLQDLVIAAGGTVLHRKPISGDQEALLSRSSATTFVIYSLELPDKCDPSKNSLILDRRRSDAEALASSTEAKVASNSWILNSIAACKLQNDVE